MYNIRIISKKKEKKFTSHSPSAQPHPRSSDYPPPRGSADHIPTAVDEAAQRHAGAESVAAATAVVSYGTAWDPE